jgi:peroxiredoxin
MRRFLTLILATFLLFACTGCGFLGDDQATEATVYAPDFTLQTVDGESVKLSSYIGRPIILNFWASWCSPCKSQMPMYQEKYDAYQDDIVFLAVALIDGSEETVESAKAYMEKSGYTFPIYFDMSNQVNEVYGVNSIPATFFIAPDGVIVGYASGTLTEDGFDDGINRILPTTSE